MKQIIEAMLKCVIYVLLIDWGYGHFNRPVLNLVLWFPFLNFETDPVSIVNTIQMCYKG